MAQDPRYPRGFNPSGGRNPLERQVINPLDLAADNLPRSRVGEPVNPAIMADPGLLDRLNNQLPRRAGRFMPTPFTVGVAAQLLIPEQPGRFYLFILNTSGANRLFVGFDYEPTATNGVTLEVNLGFYEPWIIPTNTIFIAGAGAGTTGLAIVAVEG